ncbi:Protein CBG14054 [Caenorhabditis briggsae]|uniref:ATPase V1 complex subunit H C-terminal domain-containing protein n=2 Tax=Caenorhabditis briggsae TaxID=6238 RepID=A0AAE9CUI3_CAEBR|nr:Protein CBG14054 [Caenorhabditis briggsae]ULT81572.1 hypothetical protein L3Y34_011509 [Caenorhabditis briggsae]ULT81573.1 hypothetical protein L3Y34_011509 [Caenorhabditis briggsae]UMM40885.1 hypothetical protein L5515_017386 [Caenorhabditis briggsae]CAP32719.2 Protein CBG14054 [Caenorhabditis briggsae]
MSSIIEKPHEDIHQLIATLKEQIQKNSGTDAVNATVRHIQTLLREDKYRHEFVKADGVQTIVTALTGSTNFQLQYQLIFALWCLTFNASIAQKAPSFGVIQVLGDILSESTKEKVIRIILATFANILNKIDDSEIKRQAALQMVQCKTLKTLELIESKKFDDPDLEDDVKFLTEELTLSVHDLSSYDEYYSEVRTGRLTWSPVHKSEKFWRENAARLNEKQFEVVKILIKLLENSKDPTILCVAAHDIGEYVRHYPRGKTVIEQYQGKTAVMRLLSAEDPNVRYHALLAVQKLMVHNWEYLGKQLDTDAQGDGVAAK